jgi:anti-anti-sigma factor
MSRVEVVPDGDASAWRVIVRMEIDLATTPEFQERLAEVGRNRGDIVVVDLSECHYIDSSGLATLLLAARRLTRSQGALAVVCPNAAPLRVFELTSTVETLNVAETDEKATALARRLRDRLQHREDGHAPAAD